MSSSMSWRDMYDHHKATAAMFAEKAKQARLRLAEYRKNCLFGPALQMRIRIDEYVAGKQENLAKAAEIKRLYL